MRHSDNIKAFQGAGKASAAAFVLLLCLSLSCSRSASNANGGSPQNQVSYAGTFTNSAAPDSSKATGTVSLSFDPSSRSISFTFTWSSLTSKPVAMHLHDAGPVIVPVYGYPVTTSGTVSYKASLTAAQASDLQAGLIFAMIHTANYPSGEIMATLFKH
jgi:hypothetical protein